MTRRISLIITVVGAALAVAVPTAWSAERQGPGNLAVSPEVFELTVSKNGTYPGRIGPGTLAVSPEVLELTLSGDPKEREALASYYNQVFAGTNYTRQTGSSDPQGIVPQSGPAVIHDHGDAEQAKLTLQSSPVEIVRDHGDAEQAKLTPQSSPAEIVRDHGDATQAKLDAQSTVLSQPELDSSSSFNWPQIGIGIGVGMLLLFGLFLTVRHTRTPVAH
jgi:hypothetical protein